MCKFKSGIITKDRVFIPGYDSHAQMLDELGIKDDSLIPNFVKIEILPPNGDYFAPLDTWKYTVDQDMFPDWYCEEIDRPRAFEALKEWAKGHIFTGVKDPTIENGFYYVKDCLTVKAWGNSTVTAYGNSTVEAWGNSTVKAHDNSEVTAYGNSTVEAYGNSKIDAWGNSTVTAYGNSKIDAWGNYTVEAYGNSKIEVVLHDNATFKDKFSHGVDQARK